MNARNRRIIAAADRYAEARAEYDRLDVEVKAARADADNAVTASREADRVWREYQGILNAALCDLADAVVPD